MVVNRRAGVLVIVLWSVFLVMVARTETMGSVPKLHVITWEQHCYQQDTGEPYRVCGPRAPWAKYGGDDTVAWASWACLEHVADAVANRCLARRDPNSIAMVYPRF